MKISPEDGDASIVVLGAFNPAIIRPGWMARVGLITEREADAAEIEVIHNEISSFQCDWFHIRAQKNKVQVTCKEPPWVKVSDLMRRMFGEFLSHTPITQVGINRQVHFKVSSLEVRDEIGRRLAPPEAWGEWGPQLEGASDARRNGLLALTMHHVKQDEVYDGHVQARVEPSQRHSVAIYMQINDHSDIPEDSKYCGGEAMARLLTRQFDQSIERAEFIIDQIMQLDTGTPR